MTGSLVAPSRLPALICFLLALVGALPLVVLTPPLQVADEAQHFARAYQLSELRIWSRVEDGKVGDDLPTSLSAFTLRFLGTTQEHAARRVVPQPLQETLADRARALAPGDRSFLAFRGAAFYSPLAYLPQALAIRLGRLFDASPLMLLYGGRLANALAAASLLAAAVLIAPFGKEMLVIAGLLPMALYQDASLSPDAMTMGCTFLFVAIALRAQWRGRWLACELVSAIAAGMVFCSLKPVYAPLLFVGLVPDVFRRDRAARVLLTHLLIVSCVMAATWLWMRSTATAFSLVRAGTSVHGQAVFVLAHPVFYARILVATLSANAGFYYRSAIGMFGWLTIQPPPILLVLPLLTVAVALAERDEAIARLPRAAAVWQLALAIACFALVMTSLYLVWTPVGATAIEGVQGRYFLPVLGAAMIALRRLLPAVPLAAAVTPATLMAALPLIGIAQLVVSDVCIATAYSVF